MLIGIEASAAVIGSRTGVGTYVANMIDGLQRLSASEEGFDLRYFTNGLPQAPGCDLSPAKTYTGGLVPSRVLWTQLGLRRSMTRADLDLCHFPNYLAPLRLPTGIPAVITMYDMSVYRCPQYQPRKTVAVHRALIPALARRASLILTISESARQDILHYLGVSPERVRVIYGGIAPHFSAPFALGSPTLADVRRHYRLDAPYLLTVGTLEPRKNHVRLVDAFTRLVEQENIPHHLVIVGEPGWKDHPLYVRARQSRAADRIHFLGYVAAAHLPALYRGASAFAFPSIYEGFGLPVVEAFACGVPTLISSDPALTEVAGTGTAVVVDPHSADDIARGLWQIVSDPMLAAQLRARGLERARAFSWDRCAAETLAIYRELLEGRPGSMKLF
ncbi:MAG: glycosyltransferase family 4 protein, partial [Streptosporangiaceae bacterium]|nr:glycosyltransferase family 4 protein [Streptosporangiaceae bacterium]